MSDYTKLLKDCGRYYAEMGFVVIPNAEKRPIHKGWQRWNDPLGVINGGALDVLNGLGESAGIGISCTSGQGLLILDVDNKLPKDNADNYICNGEGQPLIGRQLMRWLEEELGEFKNCPVSITRSGGFHIYYRCTSEMLGGRKQIARISANGKRLVADVRCPGAGFVVESPTHDYFWVKGYRLKPYSEIPIVPQKLLDWLDVSGAKAYNKQTRGRLNTIPTEPEVVAENNIGIRGGRLWRRLKMDDPDLAEAIVRARRWINNPATYPKTEGSRQYNFLRVLNALYWRFLLPEPVVRMLGEEWAEGAQYYDDRDKAERYRTARSTIPAGAIIGCGLR